MAGPFFVGVDVGTGSARAGVFDAQGKLLASRKHPIRMWRDDGSMVEQSSDDIWAACCSCIRDAVAVAGIEADDVAGLGFDAACSMVVLDREMKPLSVSPSGNAEQNVIVWMDHRATDQAQRINALGHAVLDYVGGRISPEMQTPKLLWLKENLPDTFDGAGQFFDLADFLTFAATGSRVRSACTVTCKWTYLAHEDRWDAGYFRDVGLGALADEGFARIGQEIVAPGTPLAAGLTEEAASAMGLRPGTAVGAGLIDAHAGWLGTVGAEGAPEALMAYVFGTSACTMASSSEAHFVPGVWGPYFSAMVPGLWLSEGGQSAAGEAIAHLIATHPATAAVEAEARGGSITDHLLAEIAGRVQAPSEAVRIAGSRIVVPDFIGNRAPFADPHATAVLSGLTFARGPEDLLETYVAALFGIGYGLRQIVTALRENGVTPEAVVVSGGAAESPTVRQLLADSAGLPIVATDCAEPVLLGAAMLGRLAADPDASARTCMQEMSRIAARYDPAGGDVAVRHDARFRAFESLQDAERRLRHDLGA